MFSFDLKIQKNSEKDKAVYRFMIISFVVILVTVALSSILNPFCEHYILSYFLTLGLFIGIFISKRKKELGANCYFLILSVFVIFIDFSGFFIHEITSFIYMFPITFSLLLLNVPRNYFYSFSTLFIYVIRTFLSNELTSNDKFFLIILVCVATTSIYFIKKWLIQLYTYKVNSLQKMHSASIKILGKVAEIKDEGTAYHLHRVELMMDLLCKSLKKESKYKNYIDNKYIHDIRAAAYLHDIGKIGIPDKILGKKGHLTNKEFETIKSHTTIGYNILSDAKIEIGGESIYDMAMEIARHHHEKWDGSGYPYNLRGEDIPFSARLMAVVDVYDALISRRPYKVPFPHSKALEIINEGSGTHFDPQIVNHFNIISDTIRKSLKRYLT